MRKIFILLLLIAGCAVIFFPLAADLPAGDGLSASRAHPSGRPLPAPWQDDDRFSLAVPAQGAAQSQPVPAAASSCGTHYTLQRGETLGTIARDCAIPLADLLAANPQITNANKVYAGQTIKLPNTTSGRGGGDPLDIEAAVPVSGGVYAGSRVAVAVTGLPADTPVRVGLGLSSAGYVTLAKATTDAAGALSLTVTIPTNARRGDEAFILVTTQTVPTVQRISQPFTIGE